MTNNKIDPLKHYPKMKLSQFFDINNNDGYMYFSKVIQEGKNPKRVPFLLKNDRTEIRLDELKKVHEDDLLLVDGKYELPFEVERDVFPVEAQSLHYKYVHDWVRGQEEYDPAAVLERIESLLKTYYRASSSTHKVLAVWIYATYFYTLFNSGFPYLIITGPKGSGKSTLENLIAAMAFNPTHAVSITEAALYRQVAFLGGTFLMDDFTNLERGIEGLAPILNAGLSDSGSVYRMDNKGNVHSFSTFGPKVISGIHGVEDSIASNSLTINTVPYSQVELFDIPDFHQLKMEQSEELRHLTSAAALSALENFQSVYSDLEVVAQENWNRKLNRVMRPLLAVAQLAVEKGNTDYYEALIKFGNEASEGVHDGEEEI